MDEASSTRVCRVHALRLGALAAVLSIALMPLFARADVLYVSDFDNGSIYKVSPAGTTSLVVQLPAGSTPSGLAFDAAGNLFVADGDHIDKVTPSGGISVFASGIPEIFGVGFDAAGNLYASTDHLTLTDNPAILRVAPDGSFTTYASLPLTQPGGFRFAANGDLYVADQIGKVLKISPTATQTLLGTNTRGEGDVALDAAGNVYSTVFEQGRVDRITPAGVETTFSTGVTFPASLAFDSNGDLFATDPDAGRVYRIDPTGAATRFADVSHAWAVAVQVPEPGMACGALAAAGVFLLRTRRRHSSPR